MTFDEKPRRVAVTGASGLIGRALLSQLKMAGHRVAAVSRGAGENAWNVATGELHLAEPADAVVHLAGRSVAARWTRRVRREIWDSRVPATQKLSEGLARLPENQRPALLISASAIGIYGNRGDEVLSEASPAAAPGASFLADLCRAWEAAAQPARDAGIRVIHPRMGIVLSRDGGALAALLRLTRRGLGGPVGTGRQFLSWISITDLVRLFEYLLTAADASALAGPINCVAPNPVRQNAFMRALGHAVHRPTIFPFPGFMVKTVFGQMGREALLASQRVISERMPAGFTFLHPTLESAVRADAAVAQKDEAAAKPG